jgi:RHS repeat-associated protein
MAVVRGESENQDGTWTKTYTYYATDHLGTVRFDYTVDAQLGGFISSSTHDYSPFGVEIGPVETSDNTHKYTGQERDPETGNDYMHYRYYADSLGRFMAPDNISGTIINPQDWNLYSYMHGNPVTFNDPTGHIATNPNIGPGNQEELHRSEDLYGAIGDGVDLVAGWGVNAFINIVTTNIYDANDNLLASVSVETVDSTPLIPTTSSTPQRATQAGKKYNRNVLEAGYHMPNVRNPKWVRAIYDFLSSFKIGKRIPMSLLPHLRVIGYLDLWGSFPQEHSRLAVITDQVKGPVRYTVFVVGKRPLSGTYLAKETTIPVENFDPKHYKTSTLPSDREVFHRATKDYLRPLSDPALYEGPYFLSFSAR